jgi:DNA-binding GntR family transcriptional regulator
MELSAQFDGVEGAPSKARSGRRRVLSVSDQVTESVREMVLMGQLAPGQQVTHDLIASELNVSTMPVREALLRLKYEGLIESGSKARSFQVSLTTRDDVKDIYWLHSKLSGELTARAASRLSGDGIAQLRAAYQLWCQAADANDPHGLQVANDQFHRIVNLGTGSPKLSRSLLHTLRLIPHHYYAMVPAQVSSSTRAHLDILNAIIARDPEAARKAAEAHVLDSGQELIKNFDDNGYWTLPGPSPA